MIENKEEIGGCVLAHGTHVASERNDGCALHCLMQACRTLCPSVARIVVVVLCVAQWLVLALGGLLLISKLPGF